MSKNIDEIIEDFRNFTLEGNHLARLGKLTDELLQTQHPEEALQAMFGILERYPEEELGSPGPLVHAIEKCKGYDSMLIKSVERQPGTLSAWMLYRLVKYDPKPMYINALRKISSHPKASEQTKEDASLILSWIYPK